MDFLKSAMEAMELPQDASPSCPYLQIYGNKHLMLENFIRIIEFTSQRLLVQCKICQLEICGESLQIRQYSRQELLIEGSIEKVSFL